MVYKNPIVKGFYPDPSVCYANGRYYLVCSTFQYFPGVALFESDDLVNFEQIGYVLTRKNQVMLEGINSSGGVFAPTIRYNNGRFYMVTTNDTTHQNFYVYTDDIYSEWSDPIYVSQGGIDPSLYFEDGRCYFMSNGADDEGVGGVVQCEINIETGEKLSPSKCIWKGSGGRFLESPHLYKIGDYYYLMAAEGGTEYGHMITYARGKSVWGEFENYPHNPVLTNRNKAPYIIQGIGHGDLIRKEETGEWFILSLGFRQMGIWMAYHHLGREVFLTPVTFHDNGWFTAADGTTDESYEIKGDFEQKPLKDYTFETTKWNIDWCFIRHPDMKNYELSDKKAVLYGTDTTLDAVASPTFVGVRQRDFEFNLEVDVKNINGEGGVCAYMNEAEHYEVSLLDEGGTKKAILRLNIGGIHHIQNEVMLPCGEAKIKLRADNYNYYFSVVCENCEYNLGSGSCKYLSTEVSGGFTGVLLGLYAVGGTTEFENFSLKY